MYYYVKDLMMASGWIKGKPREPRKYKPDSQCKSKKYILPDRSLVKAWDDLVRKEAAKQP